jgi:hypothetical protein
MYNEIGTTRLLTVLKAEDELTIGMKSLANDPVIFVADLGFLETAENEQVLLVCLPTSKQMPFKPKLRLRKKVIGGVEEDGEMMVRPGSTVRIFECTRFRTIPPIRCAVRFHKDKA